MAKNKRKPLNFSELGGLVFSTETGRMCPGCSLPVAECRCGKDEVVTGSGNVKLWYETKGRKGKGVTLIKELAMTDSELAVLAKKIKSHCGTGGSIKNGTIEIQGEQRQKIQLFLETQGIKSKMAGG